MPRTNNQFVHLIVGSILALFWTSVSSAETRALPANNLVIYKKAPRHVIRRHTEDLSQRVDSTGLAIKNIYGRIGTLRDERDDPGSACAAITAEFPDLGCELDHIVKIESAPDDLLFDNLHGMREVNATTAWAIATDSPITVAVIDTGVDYTHPDFVGNIVSGYDFVDHDDDPFDLNGHGTHVAGIIGAVGNNGIGVAGMCWKVKIMPLRILNAAGAGTLSAMAQAIEYAVHHGASVINLSLGGHGTIAAVREAFNLADSAGVLATVAAGNARLNNDEVHWFPANFANNNIISVAASDGSELGYFSDFGRTTVDLAAPGIDILSTLPGGGYGYESGTSMAAPHVAGAAALLKGSNSNLTSVQLKGLLLSSVTAHKNMYKKLVSGGVLNVGAAMQGVFDVQERTVGITIRTVQRNRRLRVWGRVTESKMPVAKRIGLYRNSRLQRITMSSGQSGRYYFRTKGPGKFRVQDMFGSATSKSLRAK